MHVAVIGLGYVGLPLAIRAAEVGHQVTGFDVDPAKVAALRGGYSYIEDIGDLRLAEATNFTATDDAKSIHGFDIGIITVPTPMRDKVPDLSYVTQAAITLGTNLKPGAIIVLESTTYPGTTEILVSEAVFGASGGMRPGVDYHLGFSPERIDPGNPHFSFETTPKIVSGTTPEALAAIRAFYDTVVVETVPVSSPRVAELSKLIENTFRHVNIALVNEMAVLSHDLGINVWEALDAADTKPFGFMKFTPGPGVGGHCLPIDPAYLSWAVRRDLDKAFRFIELAVDVNDHMPDYVVTRAGSLLNEHRKCLNGAAVLILGAAYKPGTSDIRESPATPLINGLIKQGAAITVADPHVPDWSATPYLNLEDLASNLDAFDLVIVVTDHDEFDYDKIAKRARLVLDCRNRMVPAPNVHTL